MQQKMETHLTVRSERVSFLSQALQLTLFGSRKNQPVWHKRGSSNITSDPAQPSMLQKEAKTVTKHN